MKNKFKVAFLICLFCLCALPAPLWAAQPAGQTPASPALDAHLERLAAATANIKALKSDFKQTKYISFMDETLVSEGFFTFAIPDELEWQYTKPLSSGLSYKGGKARLWSSTSADGKPKGEKSGGGTEEAIAKVIAEQLITWTRLDIAKLKKSYNIHLLEETPLTIRLTPKDLSPNNPVRDFKLVFAADGTNVEQITLFEAEDDYTQIDFFNFQRQ